MAGLDDLRKDLEALRRQIEGLKNQGLKVDTAAAEDALKRVQSDVKGVGTESVKTSEKIRDSSSIIVTALGGTSEPLGRLAQTILEAGRGALSMGEQFRQAFKDTGIDTLVLGFDELTETTRNLRTSAIDVGNTFGLGYEQIKGSYQSYIASVILAQEHTYLNRQEIQRQTTELARLGVGLDEINRTFQVAGTQQNLLSQGFLLASDSGLGTEKTFSLMAQAARTMGVSIEDSGKPIVSLENLARSTGLPISQLADKVFSTAQQFARLGVTVDNISPIVRRFSDILGPGFKGLAIEEATNIIVGLERQVNSTQAAFIAMRGGLAGPGAGVAEAQLAFEDAFKNPIEIIKSLQTTLAGVTGGKIIRFEEARANPELANQFKIQRDLLAQLTGNNDPISQRTLLSILADLQSGRQLSATQNKTLEDSLKSGTQKQEEQKSLQDRIGKAQVGLLTQIAVNTSALFERILPPQAQAAMINTGKSFAQEKSAEVFNKAMEIGAKFLENNLPEGVKKFSNSVVESHSNFMRARENESNIRVSPNINVPSLTPGGTPNFRIPSALTPNPFTGAVIPPNIPATASVANLSSKTVSAPGERDGQNITITFRGTDELTKAIASMAAASVNKTNHGNG